MFCKGNQRWFVESPTSSWDIKRVVDEPISISSGLVGPNLDMGLISTLYSLSFVFWMGSYKKNISSHNYPSERIISVQKFLSSSGLSDADDTFLTRVEVPITFMGISHGVFDVSVYFVVSCARLRADVGRSLLQIFFALSSVWM